jgi:RND superfamily putative drug exporter
MLDRIGKFAATFRYPIIAVWVALVIVVLIFAPSLSDAISADPSGYLPADEASVIAAEIAAEYFPDQASPAQAVLVIQSDNGPMRSEANQAYLVELTDWLENSLPPEAVGTVLSPADPDLASRLISEDEQVAMIFVGLRGSVEDTAVVDTLGLIQARLEAAPEGLIGYVTGSVAIASDYLQCSLESVDRTAVITIVLVVTILLLIYRSLVSPLVPLATIGVAFLVSRGIVAWLTTLGLAVSSLTEMFLVVLLFGAGTDYCLFLVSRFREYMADGLTGPEGARRTVDRVGETITSSAGTVIVGMVAMSFAQMGLFANTGPSLALGVAVALLAGLTLTPALLALLGKWAFWPGGARHAKHGGFWTKLARWVTSRPWVPLGLALIILVPLTIYGQGMPRNFDLLSDLPDDVASKAGFQVLSEHFGAGEMQPLDVIVTGIADARSPEGMAHIDALTQELLLVEGVADVRSLTLPAGQSDPEVADLLRVEGQLTLMLEMMGGIRAQAGCGRGDVGL